MNSSWTKLNHITNPTPANRDVRRIVGGNMPVQPRIDSGLCFYFNSKNILGGKRFDLALADQKNLDL
jgi:hypothetical protein